MSSNVASDPSLAKCGSKRFLELTHSFLFRYKDHSYNSRKLLLALDKNRVSSRFLLCLRRPLQFVLQLLRLCRVRFLLKLHE